MEDEKRYVRLSLVDGTSNLYVFTVEGAAALERGLITGKNEDGSDSATWLSLPVNEGEPRRVRVASICAFQVYTEKPADLRANEELVEQFPFLFDERWLGGKKAEVKL
jgi:hypothetical protein